jgi:hypothetical protein
LVLIIVFFASFASFAVKLFSSFVSLASFAVGLLFSSASFASSAVQLFGRCSRITRSIAFNSASTAIGFALCAMAEAGSQNRPSVCASYQRGIES